MASQQGDPPETVALSAQLIDPRDATAEDHEPVYRVQFWIGRGAEASYRVEGADDVREVIAWAEEQQRTALAQLGDRPFPADSFMIFLETVDELNPPGIQLNRLVGRDPHDDYRSESSAVLRGP